jgi:protoporphyrinogen oxidase
LEFLKSGTAHPIVLEASGVAGGISRTAEHHGNHIDIGGHRFFSKSQIVMDAWKEICPDMLTRSRLSRILYERKFYDYPVQLNANTIANLGLSRMAKIGMSYLKASALQRKPEKNLEDFMVNRFGVELYKTFFRDYTEKVWGLPCNQISADWGAQRIKGLSIAKTIAHALGKKSKETSLIDHFLYPKQGPGELWTRAAEQVVAKGGEIRYNCKVNKFVIDNNRVNELICETPDGEVRLTGDIVLSSMPIKDLALGLGSAIPEAERKIAEGLVYRDFMTVGFLFDALQIGKVQDNWIYVQESDVKVGRLQIFNNWSPHMVADPSKIWMGLEYFVNEGDSLWSMPDADFAQFAAAELEKIGVAKASGVLDSFVLRVPKAYPAYFGTYTQFGALRKYLDTIQNLYLMGRNGMHRYNNMDHSMLSAIEAARLAASGSQDRAPIWSVNAEDDYHEEGK